MSAGRRGAAQDKLWQLDQKLRGASTVDQPPSVVQWHSLFKSTPAAVKCNITPPPSRTASAEPHRLNGKTGFKSWLWNFIHCLSHPFYSLSVVGLISQHLSLNFLPSGAASPNSRLTSPKSQQSSTKSSPKSKTKLWVSSLEEVMLFTKCKAIWKTDPQFTALYATSIVKQSWKLLLLRLKIPNCMFCVLQLVFLLTAANTLTFDSILSNWSSGS